MATTTKEGKRQMSMSKGARPSKGATNVRSSRTSVGKPTSSVGRLIKANLKGPFRV